MRNLKNGSVTNRVVDWLSTFIMAVGKQAFDPYATRMGCPPHARVMFASRMLNDDDAITYKNLENMQPMSNIIKGTKFENTQKQFDNTAISPKTNHLANLK